jgi:hypothetical protein
MPKKRINTTILNLNRKSHSLKDEDFYKTSNGSIIFTEIYHKKRGYCCKKVCKHCPWKVLT